MLDAQQPNPNENQHHAIFGGELTSFYWKLGKILHQVINVSTLCSTHIYQNRRTSPRGRPPSAFAWKPAIHQIDPAWQLTGHKKKSKKTTHLRKLTCPLKRDYLNRKYMFQPLIFRGHVCFPGNMSNSHVEGLANMNVIPVFEFHLLHRLIFRILCFNFRNVGLSSATKWHTLWVCFARKPVWNQHVLGGINLHGLYEIGMCYASSAS